MSDYEIPRDVFAMLIAFNAIDEDGTFDPRRHEAGRRKFLAYAESKLTDEELRHHVVSGDPSDPRG